MAKTVCSKLHNDSMRSVFGHDPLDDILKELEEGIIVHTRFKGNIKCVMFAIILAIFIHTSSTREKIFTILMERHTHDSIGQVECFFHAIAMMYVNINIDDPRIDK